MFNITNVKILLAQREQTVGRTRLLAYATITLDDALVIGGLRIIEGRERRFIAMTDTSAKVKCASCGMKNRKAVEVKYCNGCGRGLEDAVPEDRHFDLVFPVNRQTRSFIESVILKHYDAILAERQADAVAGQLP